MDLENIIKQLELRYPDKLPDKEINSYQLGYLIGQQSVINYLISFKQSLTKKVKKQ